MKAQEQAAPGQNHVKLSERGEAWPQRWQRSCKFLAFQIIVHWLRATKVRLIEGHLSCFKRLFAR